MRDGAPFGSALTARGEKNSGNTQWKVTLHALLGSHISLADKHLWWARSGVRCVPNIMMTNL